MKKIGLLICYIALVALQCYADDYLIISMNADSIQIGQNHRICKVGSEFSSNEEIHWSSSKVTLIEAQNKKTKRTILFPAPQSKGNNNSSNMLSRIWNYFVSKTHLSTRESYIYDIDEALTKEDFRLISPSDTIRIKTNDTTDNKKYYASFYLKGKRHTISLPLENGDILFERGMFAFDGITFPYKFMLTIYYKEDDYYHEITNGMSLEVFDIKK